MAHRSLITPQPVRLETRADGSRIVTGYAAPFYRAGDAGTQYRLYQDLYERIAPGAFDRALRERQDVRGLFNHAVSQILGRSTANTLRLFVDQLGLRYEIDQPDTQLGRDLATHLERGDITGSSFGFLPRKVSYTRGDVIDGIQVDIRTLEDVDLFDVGPVTFPAYQGSSAGLRSEVERNELEVIQREHAEWRAQQSAEDRDADDVAVRLRLLALD